MPRASSDLNYSNMLAYLRKEFKRQGYAISDVFEEFPTLPIDLFCTKGKAKSEECCVALVAAFGHIPDEFQKKLFFYQYLLSLHYKPSQYRIVLAVPASATVETTPFYAEDEEEKNQDFYQVNGFGLWKIDNKGHIDKQTYSAISLRDKIDKDFQNIIVKEDSSMSNKDKIILPFVDKYIHDSVLALAKHYKIEFDERNIDQGLLELCLDLKTVPYRRLLFDLINDHLSMKVKNDFDFCTDVFNKLWSEYLGEEIYPEEHRKFETFLTELYPRYRDHYIHQLQVFLLGVLILDNLVANKILAPKKGFPYVSWLLAASFHDFAYPIEKYDDFVSRYFKTCLGLVGRSWEFLRLKEDYTELSFSSDVEHIVAALANCFIGSFDGETGVNNFNIVRQFFYHGITRKKNHGLIGSLGILKRFKQDNASVDFNSVVLPAAVATAIHDLSICQAIHGSNNDTTEECILRVQELAPLRSLNLEKQPLAFLLILCDNIQDWGRHFKDEELEKPLKEANIRLKKLSHDSGKIYIQLYFTDTRESRKFMNYKKGVLSKLEKMLKAPNIDFVIEYWDREKDTKTGYTYTIGNSK